MFTCPLHQWASHELPCPACQKSQSVTTADTVYNRTPGEKYIEPVWNEKEQVYNFVNKIAGKDEGQEWVIKYDNEEFAGGDGFREWWDVENGNTWFRCRSNEDAEWLAEKLNSITKKK